MIMDSKQQSDEEEFSNGHYNDGSGLGKAGIFDLQAGRDRAGLPAAGFTA
jgi:hypothetical protein